MATWRAPVVLLATATVWIAGCSATPGQLPGPTTETSPTGAPAPSPSPARTAKWTALQEGDCLQGLPPTDPAVVDVALVQCSQPHRAEVFLRAKILVNTALSETAGKLCGNGFADYTGGPVAGSPYTVVYLIDSEQDRTSNNPYPSSVICLLQDSDGRWLTDSARR